MNSGTPLNRQPPTFIKLSLEFAHTIPGPTPTALTAVQDRSLWASAAANSTTNHLLLIMTLQGLLYVYIYIYIIGYSLSIDFRPIKLFRDSTSMK